MSLSKLHMVCVHLDEAQLTQDVDLVHLGEHFMGREVLGQRHRVKACR